MYDVFKQFDDANFIPCLFIQHGDNPGAASMSITYQQLEARIRQMRRDHHGCTSRGLDVELARYFYEFPVPGDFLPALLLDLQQCAAACIGAGCEPRSPMQVQL